MLLRCIFFSPLLYLFCDELWCIILLEILRLGKCLWMLSKVQSFPLRYCCCCCCICRRANRDNSIEILSPKWVNSCINRKSSEALFKTNRMSNEQFLMRACGCESRNHFKENEYKRSRKKGETKQLTSTHYADMTSGIAGEHKTVPLFLSISPTFLRKKGGEGVTFIYSICNQSFIQSYEYERFHCDTTE